MHGPVDVHCINSDKIHVKYMYKTNKATIAMALTKNKEKTHGFPEW